MPSAEQEHRIDEMRDRFNDVRRRLDEVKQEIGTLAVTVESGDRLISATVSGGRVSDLLIDPGVYRRPDSRALAENILATMHEAQRLFEEQVNDRYREILGPDFDIADLTTPPTEDEVRERARRTSRHLFGAG